MALENKISDLIGQLESNQMQLQQYEKVQDQLQDVMSQSESKSDQITEVRLHTVLLS